MADPLIDYLKPGYPKTQNSAQSYVTSLEYVGPKSILEAAEPPTNTKWGDYDGRVTGSEFDPFEQTDDNPNPTVVMRVTCEYFYDAGEASGSGGVGTPAEESHEIEWVSVERPMLEHPQFRVGGGGANALTNQDVVDIELWRNEPSPDLRKVYKYTAPSASGEPTEFELTTNGKLFAAGILLGIETYPDFAPVARKTTAYTDGPPSESNAGLRDEPPNSFLGLPSGYEWRKSADRAIMSDGRNKWDRSEEWMGAEKVLVDRKTIYWTAS